SLAPETKGGGDVEKIHRECFSAAHETSGETKASVLEPHLRKWRKEPDDSGAWEIAIHVGAVVEADVAIDVRRGRRRGSKTGSAIGGLFEDSDPVSGYTHRR